MKKLILIILIVIMLAFAAVTFADNVSLTTVRMKPQQTIHVICPLVDELIVDPISRTELELTCRVYVDADK